MLTAMMIALGISQAFTLVAVWYLLSAIKTLQAIVREGRS